MAPAAGVPIDANLASILESMPDGAIARDRGGRIVLVNDAALELLGCASPFDIEGLSSAELVARFDMRDQDGTPLSPADLPTYQLLGGGIAVPRVVSLRRLSDRSRRWAILNGCAVRDSAGGVRLTVKLTQDVTEQYRATELHRALNAIRDSLHGDPCDVRRAAGQIEMLVADVIGGACALTLADASETTGRSPHREMPIGKAWSTRAEGDPDGPPGDDTAARELRLIQRLDHFTAARPAWTDLGGNGHAGPERRRTGDPRIVVLPLREQDRLLGSMRCSRDSSMPAFSDADVELLHDIADRVTSMVANARLRQELVERHTLLAITVRQMEETEEIQRRRMALSIHDGLAQVATSAYRHLEAFASRYPAHGEEADKDLARAQELAQRTIREARRLIASMRPTVLDDFGLVPALLEELGEMQAGGWKVLLDNALGEERFPHHTELEIFRVAQEALANVRKHAGQTTVHISLRLEDELLELTVRDEGAGFDVDRQIERTGSGDHVGLSGMRERLELLGGRLEITNRPGEGTCVIARVPLAAT